jgi:MoaD family protein
VIVTASHNPPEYNGIKVVWKDCIEISREQEIEIENNSSVADLLLVLSKKYGTPFKKAIYESGGNDIKPHFMATVNGFLLNQLKGVETKLNNGDRIVLMPVVSGG